MSKEKDNQGKVIWREIVDFFKSSHVTLTGYVLAAMIAAIGVGWLSTELKFLLLGPQSTNEIHRVTLVISGLMFVIIMLLSIIPLSEKRAQLSADPKAKNALKQIPSDGQRISLLLTLLLFTLLLDTGKDILQNIAKSAPYWVIIVGMVVLFVLFILALTISPRTSESGVRKLLKYFETPSDMWLAVVIFASGVAIACIPPLSALHYLWFAVLGGYLFLHQVRRHAVPTNMLAETEDVTPHRHLILFVSICSRYSIEVNQEKRNEIRTEQKNSESISNQAGQKEHSAQVNLLMKNWILKQMIHQMTKNENNPGNQDKKDNQLSIHLDGEALVNILSQYISWHITNRCSETSMTFSELIGHYDTVLTNFGTYAARTNWRMLFVALEKHQFSTDSMTPDTPQIVSLIVSNLGYRQGVKNTDAGSNLQIHTLIKLLSLYLIYNNLSHADIEFHLYKDHASQYFTRVTSKHLHHFILNQDNTSLNRLITQISVDQYLPASSPDGNSSELNEADYGADFYEFDSCMQAVQRLVTYPPSEMKEWDTIIDFTSGNKVVSMVATFMTTTSDVKAQYVDEMYNVKPFDLRYYDLAKLGG